MKISGLLLLLVWTSTFAQHQTSAVFASVPAKERAKTNPLANDPDAAAAGRKLFEQHCLGCHGAAAADGPRAPGLINTDMRKATPGEIYWVITKGVPRLGMPASPELSPSEKWQIVTYLTSLNTPGRG